MPRLRAGVGRTAAARRAARLPTGRGVSAPHVVVEDKWAAIPEVLLYDPTISAGAVRVYGVLRRHGSDPENCHPTHRRIAEFIGTSPRSIPAWVRELEEAGWVERFARTTPSGDPDSNGYRVFGRAVQRGVRAGEQGGCAPHSGEGCALESAPKESNLEREQLNERKEGGARGGALDRQLPGAVDRVSVQTVFDAWRESTGKKRAVLDPKRRRRIVEALKHYPPVDVLDAVNGWRRSPFHCGQNDGGQVHNDLDLLLRDPAHIEKFRDLQRGQGRVMQVNGNSQRLAEWAGQ